MKKSSLIGTVVLLGFTGGLLAAGERDKAGIVPANLRDLPKPAASEVSEEHSAPPITKLDAAGLVRNMERSLAALAVDVRTLGEEDLNPALKENRPFFRAFIAANSATSALGAAVAAQNTEFFAMLDTTGRSLMHLEDMVRLLRFDEHEVVNPSKALLMSFNELRNRYGRIAVRSNTGTTLTADEKAKASKLQGEVKRFSAQVRDLRAKGKVTANARYEALLDKILRHCQLAELSRFEVLQNYACFLQTVSCIENEWAAFRAVTGEWYPEVDAHWEAAEKQADVCFALYREIRDGIPFPDAEWFKHFIEVNDAPRWFHLHLKDAEIAALRASIAKYANVTVRLTFSPEDWDDESGDPDTYAESVFDPEFDRDGDGLLDSIDADDDGDGVPDIADKDRNGNGMPDAQEPVVEEEDDGAEVDCDCEEEHDDHDGHEHGVEHHE